MLALQRLVLPRFVQEGKKYATIAVGCTGGRHRSVLTVERLTRDLTQAPGTSVDGQEWQVTITHRELTRDGAQTRTLGIDPRAAARFPTVQAQEA